MNTDMKRCFGRYESELLDLNCMDCMELMRDFPDKAFDLAIVDPPYGLGERLTRQGKSSHLKRRKLSVLDSSWDVVPSPEYFKELFRVSVNQIVWGGNYFALPPSRCVIAWDKMQPWENFSQWEMAWTSFDKPARLFQFDNRTGGKIHPTQKPVELYRWLLHNYAIPGQKILDTHLGSGSIAVACHYQGFRLVGSELDRVNFERMVDRVVKETAQTEFGFVQPQVKG
jgi:site-specific DNA-methyltransferase (adenine-specific)